MTYVPHWVSSITSIVLVNMEAAEIGSALIYSHCAKSRGHATMDKIARIFNTMTIQYNAYFNAM